MRRTATILVALPFALALTAGPAQAAGNRVCHSDPNLHAVAIQIAYAGETWKLLHQGDCTTAGRTVQRMRSRAATSAFYHLYGEPTNISHRMAEEPSTGTALGGKSASVTWVKVR